MSPQQIAHVRKLIKDVESPTRVAQLFKVARVNNALGVAGLMTFLYRIKRLFMEIIHCANKDNDDPINASFIGIDAINQHGSLPIDIFQ